MYYVICCMTDHGLTAPKPDLIGAHTTESLGQAIQKTRSHQTRLFLCVEYKLKVQQ